MKFDLHHGDCLDVLRGMADNSVDLIATDPPYFKVKSDQWDWQWDKPEEFLTWIGQQADQWARVLKPNGSLYVFASPQMAWGVEGEIGKRFNVLNRIVWRKENGKHKGTEKEAQRAYFPQTEHLIFAEHFGADNMAKGEATYGAKCDELRGFVFEPLRAYLVGERDRAGFTTRKVAEAYQQRTGSRTVTGMAGHWFERVQWTLPTAETYEWLRSLFGGDHLRREYEDLRREYEDLRREYEDLRREYEDLRRPFSVSDDVPCTDVWDFPVVQPYPGKHPCEKPLEMMEHIIQASTKPGAVVFDGFLGAGTTGVAAIRFGRQFVGCELDAGHFARASARIELAALSGLDGKTLQRLVPASTRDAHTVDLFTEPAVFESETS
jgi:adenine-specific DNA-methyltransferase